MKKLWFILPTFMAVSITPLVSLSSCRDNPTTLTVSFTNGGGGILEGDTKIEVDPNVKWCDIKKPTAKANEGYTFVGWFLNDEKIDDADQREIVTTIAVVARFESSLAHSVSFNAQGGEVTSANPIRVETNQPITKPTLADRPGYDKDGVVWVDKDGKTFDFQKGTDHDIVLFARWGQIKQYNVEFIDADSQQTLSEQTIDYNHFVQRPTNPIKEGYTFDDWYTTPSTGDQKFDFGTRLTQDQENINIYGRFIPIVCNITYITNGGTLGQHTSSVQYGQTIATKPEISRDGYDSSKVTWWLDQAMTSQPFTFGDKTTGTPVEGNINLFAKWVEPDPDPTVTVTFVGGEHGVVEGTTQVDVTPGTSFKSVSRPSVTANEGWLHVGWDKDNDYVINSNTTVTATYIENFYDYMIDMQDFKSILCMEGVEYLQLSSTTEMWMPKDLEGEYELTYNIIEDAESSPTVYHGTYEKQNDQSQTESFEEEYVYKNTEEYWKIERDKKEGTFTEPIAATEDDFKIPQELVNEFVGIVEELEKQGIVPTFNYSNYCYDASYFQAVPGLLTGTMYFHFYFYKNKLTKLNIEMIQSESSGYPTKMFMEINYEYEEITPPLPSI